MNQPKTGRNDPCPCGSGKKYKQCCLATETQPTLETLMEQGRKHLKNQHHELALETFKSALAMSPKHAGILASIASILMGQRRINEAIPYLEKQVRYDPSANSHVMLGNALHALGRFEEAATQHREAIRLYPGFPDAHNNLGNALASLGRHEEALVCFKESLDLFPQSLMVYNNIGNSLQELGRYEEAMAAFRKSIASGDSAVSHSNLGNLLLILGRYDEAVVHFRAALALQPDMDRVRSNLLFGLCFVPGITVEQYLEEARIFGDRVTARAKASPLPPVAPRPVDVTNHAKPIRVGFVSGDFKAHPVSYFLESVLTHLDKDRFTWIAFSTSTHRDAMTDRLQTCFQEWCPLIGMGDREAAEYIRAQHIDILFDLTGHTALSRLPTFAWRPAPVQISWLGYFASTGLSSIDYLLTDPVSSPAGAEIGFSETLIRLPDTRLCFTPPKDGAIPIAPAPALTAGHVTFGCFQRLSKITDDVLRCWAEILNKTPETRLLLKGKGLEYADARRAVRERFSSLGGTADRLDAEGESSRTDYLNAYARVDMMLDTFPFPGGTTTCEALWMGVPTLTLCGNTLLSRQGASLLAAAGLHEWIVDNTADYIRRAVTLAARPAELNDLRQSLRERLLVSPLMDAARFARALETCLDALQPEGNR